MDNSSNMIRIAKNLLIMSIFGFMCIENAMAEDSVHTYGVFGLIAVDDNRPPKNLADLKDYTIIFLQNPTMIHQFDLAGLQFYADQMKRDGIALRQFYEQTRQEGQVHVKKRVSFKGTKQELEKWLTERRKNGGNAADGVPRTVDTEFGTFTQDGRQVFGVYNGERVPDRQRFREKSEVRYFMKILGTDPLPNVGENDKTDAFLQRVIDRKMTPFSFYMSAKDDCDWFPERTEYIETVDEKHARILEQYHMTMRLGGSLEYYLNRTNAGALIP